MPQAEKDMNLNRENSNIASKWIWYCYGKKGAVKKE